MKILYTKNIILSRDLLDNKKSPEQRCVQDFFLKILCHFRKSFPINFFFYKRMNRMDKQIY